MIFLLTGESGLSTLTLVSGVFGLFLCGSFLPSLSSPFLLTHLYFLGACFSFSSLYPAHSYFPYWPQNKPSLSF